MNVKKMFAATAGVLLAAVAVVPASALGAASYGAELQGAYEYAFSKGITTMTSIDSANMYGELTRGQLAKMIANWSEAELGTKADETKVCSFTDANKAEGDLASYVKKACQMGLMGQGIAAFRPNDKVTRGEFGTTLSRALWGDKYNTTETPYYKNHLVALKDAGIMKMIDTPNQMEVRGYVMLMLQRATANNPEAACKDPLIVLACTLGSDTCPANCKKSDEPKKDDVNPWNGEKAGDLSIILNSTNGMTSIPSTGVVKIAEMTMNATQDVQLHSLNVTRLGLSQNQGLKVWIEKDGRRISSSSSFFGDSKANLVFNGGYVVKKGEKLDLVISLEGVAAGSELSFKVSEVASSAKNTTISPDTTGVYRTANYAVTSLKFENVAGNKRSYNISKDSSFSFGEFKVLNQSPASMEKNVLIKAITFKVEGADIANLKDFKLLRNGKELKSVVALNGKDVTLVINDQLDSGKSAVYKVVATPTNIENRDGDKYTFKIRRESDVIAEEIGQNSVGYRVAIDGVKDLDLKETTIAGGTITLARDANFPSVVNADWGYSDVVIAKGTIKLNQATKFEDGIVLTRKGATPDLTKVVRRASIIIGGRTYQATKIEADKLIFGAEVYLDKGTHDIELQVSIQNTETTGLTKFELNNISKDSFKDGRYMNSDETVFDEAHLVGTLRIAAVNIQAQRISFKKTGPAEDVRLVEGNTDEKVLFAGEVTNSSDKTLELSQFKVLADSAVLSGGAVMANGTKTADVSLHLVDGSVSSTVAVNVGTTGSIDSITTTLEPGKTLKFELRGINNPDLKANDRYRFKVWAEGTLEGNTVKTTQLNSAYVRVTDSAQTSIITATAKNLIVLPGTSTEIASFNYNVKNDSIDVSKVEFTSNIADGELDDIAISFGDITPAVEKIEADGAKVTVTFANLVTLAPKNYAVKVSANFAEKAVKGDAKTLTQVKIADQTGTLAYTHWVAKAFPILAVKEKNTNSGNERLDLNVTKNTDDHKVVLDQIYASTGSTSVFDVNFKKVTGTAGAFTGVELSKSNAEVARSTTAKTAVFKVKFTVTDDYGVEVEYDNVNASNIADFASLSL